MKRRGVCIAGLTLGASLCLAVTGCSSSGGEAVGSHTPGSAGTSAAASAPSTGSSATTTPSGSGAYDAVFDQVKQDCAGVRQSHSDVGVTAVKVGLALEPGAAAADPSSPTGYKGGDVDLTRAIAACLGIDYSFNSLPFAGTIPAVSAGHLDFAIAGVYDTAEREAQVAFVDYMKVKEAIVVKKDANFTLSSLMDLCGKTASEPTGYFEVSFLQQQSKKCTTAGKPAIKILQFSDDPGAYQALSSGRATIHMDGAAGVAGFLSTNPGFKIGLGPLEGPQEGVVVAKSNTKLQQGLLAAFKVMQADGATERIFKQWKLADTSIITDPAIRP